jgi:hypothetical protein
MEDAMPDTREDTPVTPHEEQAAAGHAETEAGPSAAKGRPPKKRRALKAALWLLALIVGLPIVAAAILTLLALVFRSDPSAHMPEGFDAYASLPSASAFLNEALHLKAVDAALSGPESAALRGTMRSLRANPILRSPLFLKLADIRVDAAVYGEGDFVLAADLGLRSALTRLAPAMAKSFPSLLDRAEGLSFEAAAFPPHFLFENGEFSAYALFYRNVLVIASDLELLQAAARPKAVKDKNALAKALSTRGPGSLRFLAEPASFTEGMAAGDGPLARLLSGLDFPSLSVVDLGLKDERVSLAMELPYLVRDESLRALFDKRSRTPQSLTRLPASTSYFSLLAAGAPSALWQAASGLLGADTQAAYKTADDAAKLAFGMGIDALLFSWMGDEQGVFGSDRGPAPVFFASIGDERARKDVFDKAFGSLLLGRDLSAVVDGVRVPRIIFPRWLRAFLESLGITLVEPFYLVHDGILYASPSAELLAGCVAELRAEELLVKTERWKETAAAISPESSAMLYYNLDRSVPFFLRSQEGLSQALKLYRRGLASLNLSGGSLRLELSASSSPSIGLAEIAGFPVKAPGRIDSDPVAGMSPSGSPMAYWSSDRSIIAMDLSSGLFTELKLDDKAWVALDAPGGAIEAVWAVSARGTVYRCDPKLEPMPGFPLLTGLAVSAAPALSASRLAVPVSGESSLLFVDTDGRQGFSTALHARLRNAPTAAPWGLAALPRSFDSALYLLDGEGGIVPGWPVPLSGIASAPPVITDAQSIANARIAAISEEGELSAYTTDGAMAPGFPLRLYGVFDSALAWAPAWRSFFLVSAEGTLYRVGADGQLTGSVPLKRGPAAGSLILARDENGDGREELYVAGGGDALYAYGGDLTVLEGFPVSGAGLPVFIDIDGDGRRELVTRGIDHTIHAYAQR